MFVWTGFESRFRGLIFLSLDVVYKN